METTTEVKIDKNVSQKKITVTKHFNAKPQQVWDAWTKKEILDQWWAPKPWRAETNSFDFKEGGSWHYAMVGPKNEHHYAKFDFVKSNALNSFEGKDAFTDEKGEVNSEMPQTTWKNHFCASDNGTEVTSTLTFKSEADMKKLIDSGFEEGFKLGLGNLEDYLERSDR